MLQRMNESHYAVTGWALEHWKIRENDRILDIGCGGGAFISGRNRCGKTFRDSICSTQRQKNSGNCLKMQDLERYGFT